LEKKLTYDVKAGKFIPLIKGIQTVFGAGLFSMFILAMNIKFRRKKN